MKKSSERRIDEELKSDAVSSRGTCFHVGEKNGLYSHIYTKLECYRYKGKRAYGRTRSMKITGNPFIQNALPRLMPALQSQDNGKRSSDRTEAQRYVDDLKRLAEEEAAYQKRLSADSIAKKIARGEYVTQAERDQVRGVDEEMLRKAEQANFQRQHLKARLANSRTKEEAKAILAGEKITAGTMIKKGDDQYVELYAEAVKQEEENYFGNGRKPVSLNFSVKSKPAAAQTARLFDERW